MSDRNRRAGGSPVMDRVRRWLTPVVVAAALVGVFLLVRDQGAEAARAFARADAVPLLAASVLANIAGLVLAVHAWRVLIPGDHPVRGLLAAKIYFLGQLSKYVPGRVWGVLTHIAHGRAAGVPGARMTSAYVLSLALTLLTGAAVGLAAAPAALPGHWYWLCPPVLVFLAGIVRPAIITRPVTWLTRLARRPVDPPPDTAVRRAVLLALASWAASGLHLWFLLLAVGAPRWSGLGAAVGGFALATVVSSLAVIVPDGWGVRELTLTAALATVLPGGLAAAAALASRLVCVLAELGSSAVVLAWSRLRESREAREAREAPPAAHPAKPPHRPAAPIPPVTPAPVPPGTAVPVPVGNPTPAPAGTPFGTSAPTPAGTPAPTPAPPGTADPGPSGTPGAVPPAAPRTPVPEYAGIPHAHPYFLALPIGENARVHP